MPASIDGTSNSVNRKCGDIIITMKKNAKNVYSFNCWFCDTICVQMKKFTMHLEQEHEKELEESLFEETLDRLHSTTGNDGITMPDIKVEDCLAEDIKSENEEVGENEIENEDQQLLQITTGSEKKNEAYSDTLDPLETTDILQVTPRTPLLNNTKVNFECRNQRKKAENVSILPLKSNADIQAYSEEDNDYAKDNSDSTDNDTSTYSDYRIGDSVDEGRKQKVYKRKISDSEEKELTVALIKSFKGMPQLWDTSQEEKCNVKQRDDLLQHVTDNLNTELRMNLKLYTIKKKLSLLCKEFEKDLENEIIHRSDSNEPAFTPKLWCYKQMEFLKASAENKIKHKRKKPNHRVKPLSDKHLGDIIEIYKSYSGLWNVNHLAYTIKEKRHEAMNSMLDEIKTKLGITLDAYKLEKHLAYIHKLYAKEKQLKLECERRQQQFEPSCFHYSNCSFLELHQGPFRCDVCSEMVATYNDFQIHKSTHDDTLPFKCQECGMGFKKISNYTIHAKRHLRVFKFHCKICGKGYPFNAELDLHMRSHTGAQPFLCSICGEGFRTAISYDNHIRRHEERFKYFCHICKKGFNHMTRLNDHVKAHLNVRDVICTVCGKGFTSRKYLNHHKRIHEGKNYNCSICGKSFAQDAGLRAHKKYHGTPIGVSSIQKEQNKYNL